MPVATAAAAPAQEPQALPHREVLIIHAFTQSLNTVFLVAAIVCVTAFVFAILLPERPLRATLASTDVGEAFAMPTNDDPITQIARGLPLLSHRDVQRQLAQESIARAGVDLRPIDWWILARTNEAPTITIEELARPFNLDPTYIDQARTALEERDLLSAAVPIEHGQTERTLTPEGRDLLNRLVAARSLRLAELLKDWSPDQHRELATLISRLATEATAVGCGVRVRFQGQVGADSRLCDGSYGGGLLFRTIVVGSSAWESIRPFPAQVRKSDKSDWRRETAPISVGAQGLRPRGDRCLLAMATGLQARPGGSLPPLQNDRLHFS